MLQTGCHEGMQFDLSGLEQPGQHNRENAAAAGLAALAFGRIWPGSRRPCQRSMAFPTGSPTRGQWEE